MICIAIDREALTISMDGHAGYADAGSDIVCAAASILAYTLAARWREITGGAGMHAAFEPGRACISINPEWNKRADCTSAMDTIAAGFDLLAAKYPEYVMVQRGAYIKPG